ncbi:hypothetical protein N0V83_000727 [Neocucurbitaria cava]|uniref:Uncharacterized protein n=1 Tax=Neocucurbitaria cava TaxID=798079 RepID=A0A9W8YKE1_9PLEO|nr:hypothetical protein N0V83_000727 [Neocucurbitaria cava]
MSTHPNAPAPPQELIDWFSSFPPFVYDPNAGIQSNFDRLAAQRQWGHKLKNKRWYECQKIAFAALYGDATDASKLEKWQELCREVHIMNPPPSITQCRKVLGSPNVRVNIVNLIDHRLTGVPVIRFPNYATFRDYTKNRMFPREEAKEEGFLKALLRRL